MATHYLNASIRYTEAASKIESFLDDHELDLSPNLFSELDVLAEEVETIEDNYKTEIDELRNEKDELVIRIQELENELEEKE